MRKNGNLSGISFEYTVAYLSRRLSQAQSQPLTLRERVRMLADIARLLPTMGQPFRQARLKSASGSPAIGRVLTSPDVYI